MKFFAKIKSKLGVFKKLLVALMIVTSVNVVEPKKVQALDVGELVVPIMDFLVWLGDGVMSILHHDIMNQQGETVIHIKENNFLDGIKNLLFFVFMAVAIAGAITATIMSLGAASLLATFAWSVAASVIGVGGFFAGAQLYSADFWGAEVVIPAFSYTPEEIFKGRIPLFNVNFFETSSENLLKPEIKDGGNEISVGELKDYDNSVTLDLIKSEVNKVTHDSTDTVSQR